MEKSEKTGLVCMDISGPAWVDERNPIADPEEARRILIIHIKKWNDLLKKLEKVDFRIEANEKIDLKGFSEDDINELCRMSAIFQIPLNEAKEWVIPIGKMREMEKIRDAEEADEPPIHEQKGD